MLVDGEGNAKHLARKDYSGRCGAESLGKLRLVIRSPQLGEGSRSRAVEQNAALLCGAALAELAPAVFLARVVGPRVQPTRGDHRVAVGIGQSRKAMAQAGTAQGAEAGYRRNVFSGLSCSRHLLQGILHHALETLNQSINAGAQSL